MESVFNQPNQEQFVDFDEIENAFKKPTQYQHFYESGQKQQPGYEPSDEFPQHLVDPDGTAYNPEEVEAETVVDHEHAMRTGERIARLIDTGIDFTLSNFVAKNGQSYKADERDLQDIAEAWGEISEERQWNIGPEWTLAILYMMVYGPLVKQAITDRRMAEIEARQKMLEERIRIIEETKNNPENGSATKFRVDPDYRPGTSPYTYQPAAEAQAKD